ncbi:AprI/Inh family metalloprotease inhibitor [Xanthobacter sp. V0B-10]|uniref:protease inhibitor Inh/omp19 family protein n=1 Tax=Xanthobacter albus TaxID=3119929 RepID=UPI0037262EA6
MPVRSRAAAVAVLAMAWWWAPQAACAQPREVAPGAVAPAFRAEEAAARLAGQFRLASADGERRCDLTLAASPVEGGFSVTLDPAACAAISFATLVRAWAPDAAGSIRLLNAQGRTVAEFTEATGGSFEALREGDGVYFLGPPGTGEGLPATPEEVMGEWLLSRGAGPAVCRWTLGEARAPGGGYRMEVAPDCDESLTRFGAGSWELSGGNILVRGVADGSTIRFARQEDGTWARVPERNRPLLMTRP